MIAIVKHHFLTNKTIKMLSLIIGYSIWSYLGHIYQINTWVNVPVCYYNVAQDTLIKADHEKLSVHLTGKRDDMRFCSDIALHIDASKLQIGQHYIMLDEEALFLPKTVKMIHCKPLKVCVTVSKKETLPI